MARALAEALRDAHGDVRAAEERVAEFLQELLPEWRRRFPATRGWRWRAPHTIDVWGALDSPAASAALANAGFLVVTIHDHSATNGRCACITRDYT